MSEIFVNDSGLQSQISTTSNSTNTTEQSVTSYASQSSAHQEGLDGAARFDVIQFVTHIRQTVGVACATSHNIVAFIRNASQTTLSVDKTQSGRFANN